MGLRAESCVVTSANSLDTGRELATRLLEQQQALPGLVVTYLTVNHDQPRVLAGLREVLGSSVVVVGCSTQGLVGAGTVREDGYAAGAMALWGSGLRVAHSAVEDIAVHAEEKGAELGRRLCAELGAPPKVVVLHYDALCGVDPERFIDGLFREVECPIVGGAAAHSFNYQGLQVTYQYIDDRVLTRAATAFALAGEVRVEIAGCHGCSPVGVELTVTRAEANVMFELDGRPAVEVWSEICGDVGKISNQSAALAIGVPVDGVVGHDYFVRAAYALDAKSGGVALGPAIAEGTRIMLHHRTIEDVMSGAFRMGRELRARFATQPRAVLGFECGARTGPFLGPDATLRENVELQRAFGDGVAWLGMMPWGEIFPVAGRPSFHNYSYPLLVLGE